MRYPTAHAKQFLNTVLNLPTSGEEQDWEIEVDFYTQSDMPQDCKEALVALIFASFEDAGWVLQFNEEQWRQIFAIVRSNHDKLEDKST